jgi:hypothetical protein
VANEKEREAVNADMERRNDYRTGCAEGAPESSGPLQLRNCQRMANVRIPMAVCAAVNEILIGSHPVLDAKFQAAGALGPPPDLPHHSKWKTWLFKAGNDPNVDSLGFLGNLIEEFMDLPPAEADPTVDFFGAVQDPVTEYQKKRERIARRWRLDRRAENPSKPGLQAMLLPFALPLSGVATPNLTLRSGE